MMTLEDKIMIFGLLPVLVGFGWVLSVRVWQGKTDAYTANWAAHLIIGQSGRDGFNAFVPLMFASVTFAYLGMLADRFFGRGVGVAGWLGDWVPITAGIAVGVMVLAWWMLLFLSPRFLAPPWLRSRDHRGWIPQAIHQARARREHRRLGSDPSSADEGRASRAENGRRR